MNELSHFQRDILYVLAGLDSPYGLEIKREIETYYDRTISHGHLYPNLDQLIELGLVNKGEIDKRTNSYTLSEAGKQAITDRVRWEQQYIDIESHTI